MRTTVPVADTLAAISVQISFFFLTVTEFCSFASTKDQSALISERSTPASASVQFCALSSCPFVSSILFLQHTPAKTKPEATVT